MAVSILQNIADTIVTRLQNITVANAYEFEVGTVKIATRDKSTWNPKPKDIMVQQMDAVPNEEASAEGNPYRSAYDVAFEIHGFASQLDVDAAEPGVIDTGTTDNHMIAAIMKSIVNNDATDWQTFGSNAITAEFTSFGPFDAPGHDGGMVALNVLFRIEETDPYTKG